MDVLSFASLSFSLILIIPLALYSWHQGSEHKKRYLYREQRELKIVKERLTAKLQELEQSDNNEEEALFPDKKGLRRLVDIDTLIDELSPETIICDRLKLIGKMRKSAVKVNVNTLQQMTLARESKQKGLHLSALAANLSIMLGLLGTVLGLSIMVQQIDVGLPTESKVITMDSWLASIKHIRGVLSGMKVGFISTFFGLASAIGLSWLNHNLANAQSAFLDDLDRFTIEELLPATLPATEDDSLLERVSFQLEQGFDQLLQISISNKSHNEDLRAIQEAFLKIIENIKESTRTTTSEKLLELLGRFTEVNQAVVNYTDSLPKFSKEIQDTYRANAKRTDNLITLYEQQRSLWHWPWQIKVAFAFMAILNIALIGVVIYR